MASRRIPTARLIGQEGAVLYWEVRWPHRANVQSKAYVAMTSRGRRLAGLLTAAKRKPVAPSVAKRITPMIEAALAAWTPTPLS